MGLQGKSYREILAFYYPHTVPFQWTRMAAEHVVVFSNRPETDRRVIGLAERAYAGSPLPWPKPSEVQIWVYPTVETFRNGTAEPGWVAARTSGTKIEMQPSEVLEKRGALESTVRHEMLHAFVESAAVPGLPLWFREGLVEWLAGGKRKPFEGANDETAMRQRQDRAAAERGYADAEARVAELVQRYGETTVLGWVVRGLPAKYSSVNNAATKSK
jgi:stage II sporulation protein D